MTEKVLLVKEDCPACELLEIYLYNKGTIDQFKFVDVSLPENRKWAESMGIKEIPDCAIVEETPDGMSIRKCTNKEWLDIREGK